MNTPISDFLEEYSESEALRLHMPGHKGAILPEMSYDITEIDGADSLYHANGIIKESEDNLTSIFDTGSSFYSCEGSSLSIRAMLYLAKAYACKESKRGYILATRNAHSSLVSASVLLDFDIFWLFPEKKESYLSCPLSAKELESVLREKKELPFAVYVTSPDYLGNMLDIKSLSEVCKKFEIPFLVDNAHGAYLKFLKNDLHPIALGATMCADSAHKTLPVLTGGAYLHISKEAPRFFKENAKLALGLFGSTSPSYLILKSLDKANKYLSQGYCEKIQFLADEIYEFKNRLSDKFEFLGDEKLKITINAKKYGYFGYTLASLLKEKNIFCEFSDSDFVVFMLTPENHRNTLKILEGALLEIPRKEEILTTPPVVFKPVQAISTKEAYFSPKEEVDISCALGRILATSSVICPPAVNIIVSGEEFNESIISACKYYGVRRVSVIKK